ncbi:chemotaxis protein CheD [Pseudoalteromonas sp. Of11M-6]|uniref:chemotaxis protein CheD n=1 Tax=Pseudoalteromonas sp. Of11M-6 TaxID=2917754 RepID=UPI001EF54918|nr:chemotaxis protein CheD [Pseudoalteromonas sp. Of11M-6]MCG7553869.1 chemotaxis protein CheD [Pseudoalteromonas sp. Of11M-6]
MLMPNRDVESIFLQPGSLAIESFRPATLNTLLGSCVSFVLVSKQHQLVVVSHMLLPTTEKPNDDEPAKYVDKTFSLVRQYLKRFSIPENCVEIKLFGGGEMFKTSCSETVGMRNIEMSHKLIDDYGFRLIARDVGGPYYRRIQVDLKDGACRVDRFHVALSSRRAT